MDSAAVRGEWGIPQRKRARRVALATAAVGIAGTAALLSRIRQGESVARVLPARRIELQQMRRSSLGGILEVGKDAFREGGGKQEGRMQYLATMDLVDPGPLMDPQQFLGMYRPAVLLDHVIIDLKLEGKIFAGGPRWGEGYSVYM